MEYRYWQTKIYGSSWKKQKVRKQGDYQQVAITYNLHIHRLWSLIQHTATRGVFMLQRSTLLLQGPYWLSVEN